MGERYNACTALGAGGGGRQGASEGLACAGQRLPVEHPGREQRLEKRGDAAHTVQIHRGQRREERGMEMKAQKSESGSTRSLHPEWR